MSREPFAELGQDGGFDLFGAAPTPERPASSKASAAPVAPDAAPDPFAGWEIEGELVESRGPVASREPEPVVATGSVVEVVSAKSSTPDGVAWSVVEEERDSGESHVAATVQSRPPETGDCVGSNYLLLRRCGQGNDHESFQALDLERRVEVLVRIHAPGPRPQLLHEAQSLSRLRHPAMPQVLDLGVTDRAAFVVFAPEIGLSLPAFACASGGCSPAAVLRMAYHLTQALLEAERHGVRFGRLLPEQIRIGPDGMPKIFGLDAGLSPGAGSGSDRSRHLLGDLARAAFDLPPTTAEGSGGPFDERLPLAGFEGPLGIAQVLEAIGRADAADDLADALDQLASAARRFGLDADAWHVDLDVDPLGAL